MVVAGDLILDVTEESSLLLLLLTLLINNPFLVFKELSVLLEGLVDVGGAFASSGVALGHLGGSGGVG